MDKEKYLKAFGARIKEARTEKQWSQAELAKKVGTSKSVISGYETGRNDPAQSMVIKLSEVLEVSINWLMGWEDKPKEVDSEETIILARKLNKLDQSQIDLINNIIDQFESDKDS